MANNAPTTKLMMAFTGINGLQDIQYATFDGQNWSAPIINGASGTSFMPALAMYNGTLYMAWKGIDRPGSPVDVKIYYSSYDGNSWAPQQIVPNVGTSGGLSLAVLNNTLYLAWKGQTDDTRIFYASFDGSSWTPQQIVAGAASDQGPGLTTSGNNLLMAWTGINGDQDIHYATFNGQTWAAPITIETSGTSFIPALANYNGVAYMAWKGIDRPGAPVDVKIYYSSFNGSTWAPQQIIPNVGTSGGMGLAVLNNQLYLSWKGQVDDTRIFYASYNGSGWSAQQIVNGAQTAVGPGMAAF